MGFDDIDIDGALAAPARCAILFQKVIHKETQVTGSETIRLRVERLRTDLTNHNPTRDRS